VPVLCAKVEAHYSDRFSHRFQCFITTHTICKFLLLTLVITYIDDTSDIPFYNCH